MRSSGAIGTICVRELGDFILQAVFFAQMAAEEKRFDIGDALDAINEKLIRRHPHVFADESAETGDEVLKRWDEIKAEERKAKAQAPQGLLAAGAAGSAGAGGGAADFFARGAGGLRLAEHRRGFREAG